MAITTITEAGDVNTLLNRLLGRSRPGFGVPTSVEARDAAANLAAAASKKYQGAGLNAGDVLAAWPTDPASEIDKLTAAARGFGLATSVCDDTQLHSELARLGKPALGQLLAQVDDIRAWVADKLEVLEEHVARHLDHVDADLYTEATVRVAGAAEAFAETVTRLYPARDDWSVR